MSKLLILGASFLQLPAILKAKEFGHYVAVADFNSQAMGIKYADEYFNASTNDIRAICDVAKRFQPDGIMTLATDMPVRSLAVATNLLGLPGISFETAVKATDKGEMIKAFKEHNVESPWYFIIDCKSEIKSISNQLIFPCILKPTDNAGSRGVVLVNSLEKLDSAYAYSREQSRGGKVIVEEYMNGSEVSVEVMVVDGDVHVLAVTDKLTTGAPHFVEMGHSQQSQLCKENVDQIRDLAARAVKAIGIKYGPAHVEIMLTKYGPKMVELGARMGGDCIATHLVPLSTGIDMIKATINVALGKTPDIKTKFDKGSAIRYFDVPSGIIKSISGVKQAKKIDGIREIIFTKSIGETVSSIHGSPDRVGYVIASGNNVREAITSCEKAMSIINISIININK
jgi:biotin carboxylase